MKNKRNTYCLSLCVLALCSLCLCGSFASAAEQIDRYDMGQRLVQLERAWDAHTDAAARARALPVLKLAVPQLLADRAAEAAATLDRSRLLLQSAEPTAAERWAAALLVHPDRRLLDPASGPLAVRILPAYPAGSPPSGAALRLTIVGADGKPLSGATNIVVAKLPIDATIATDKLPEGDHTLRVEVLDGDKVLATYSTGISAVPHLQDGRNWLRTPGRPPDDNGVDGKTLHSLTDLLIALARGSAPETNYPAARLLAEKRELGKSGQEFYGPQRTGQFWLTLPAASSEVHVRLFVPDAAKTGKPLPLVVALHGAGGSENLFFDAYGYGLIARLAQKRGWLVVAPRAGWLFDAAPPAAAIVDELAKIYPVDKQRVYMVGHSMGAMQAVTLAQESPGRFAAIAALGGGGAVTKLEVFKDLPVFIGCGREDFLLGGAKGLAEALEKAGATKVTYKEYPGVEHMLVVQEALPEVFNFFAAAVVDASKKGSENASPKHR